MFNRAFLQKLKSIFLKAPIALSCHTIFGSVSNQIFNRILFFNHLLFALLVLNFPGFRYSTKKKFIWVAINNTNSWTWTCLLQVHWFIAVAGEIEIKFFARLPAALGGGRWWKINNNMWNEIKLRKKFIHAMRHRWQL